MEDLWKDITLSTLSSSTLLHNYPSSPTTIFQDFLARVRPFSSKNNNNLLPAFSASNSHSPQTILTLTNPNSTIHTPTNYTFYTHSPPSPDHNSCSLESNKYSSDRRHERMIKNRESAARSRARKQAYTYELELEVAQLKQENARLRLEQQMKSQAALERSPNKHMCNQVALEQFPKKHKLHRTSSAPF